MRADSRQFNFFSRLTCTYNFQKLEPPKKLIVKEFLCKLKDFSPKKIKDDIMFMTLFRPNFYQKLNRDKNGLESHFLMTH